MDSDLSSISNLLQLKEDKDNIFRINVSTSDDVVKLHFDGGDLSENI